MIDPKKKTKADQSYIAPCRWARSLMVLIRQTNMEEAGDLLHRFKLKLE